MKTVEVIGLGHIGLPTACLFANHGCQVVGVDVNGTSVAQINQGKATFEEPGLPDLLQDALRANRLVTKVEIEAADVFIIAVPTPLDRETRIADLRYVREAAKGIAKYLKVGDLVILESTVPPETSNKMLCHLLEESGLKAGDDFSLAHCPERANPGNTIYEMIHNDRIIGGVGRRSAQLTQELYSGFVRGNIHLTDLKTAEIVKLMENASRDVNIALANDLAQLAERYQVNVWEAIELVNKHPRVNILKPGPGVGGHCVPIDPWFLSESSTRSRIISLAREVNDAMPHHVLSLVKELLGGLKDATITVLGVAYKGNVDDTRETPALKFIKIAENEEYKVRIYDPWVKHFDYELLPLEVAVQGSDCIVLITDHSQFRQIDPREISPLVRNRNLVDTRNILDRVRWEEAGFRVKVLGCGW